MGAPDELRWSPSTGCSAGLSAPTGITPGAGVLGRVVASGEGVRGIIGSGPAELKPVATEPGEGDILATPLRSMGAVIGVLALYGREDGRPFDAADDGALRTLARQAGTAIDNVQLHQEATRLSTTDGLTGLWNFRYLSMSLAREIERSTRFDRPLAVLMLDLDHFKQVNDSTATRAVTPCCASWPSGPGADPRGRHVRALRRRGVRRRTPGDHRRGCRPARRAHLRRRTPRAVPCRGRGAARHHRLGRRRGLPRARRERGDPDARGRQGAVRGQGRGPRPLAHARRLTAAARRPVRVRGVAAAPTHP